MTYNDQRSPADYALRVRLSVSNKNAINGPGAFCRVLLQPERYVLPQDVNHHTWTVALRYFAELDPTPDRFRRSLEIRRRQSQDRLDGGARVASYLLAQWDLYLKRWAIAQSNDDVWRTSNREQFSYEDERDDLYEEINEELADLSQSFARSESSGWFYADRDDD